MTAIEYRRIGRAEDTVGERAGFSLVGDEGEFFGIGEISEAPDLALIFDEVGFRDEGNREPAYLGFDPIAPDLIEGHLADGGEDVNVVLLRPEAEILFVIEEVGGGETFKGNSECEQRVECGAGVIFRWPDEDVEVVGGADVAVSIHRDSADYRVFNVGGEKRGEE
jgi:hypothetical protein